jgi:DNA invertase Pin-like site-specific DNA recombinase
MRLAAYCQTSTANGPGSDPLGAREQACRDWATANDHRVVAVHRDDGLSGALGVDQRAGLAAALLALESADGGPCRPSS